MAENVLEILLGGEFSKNFKQMDDNLAKIEQHTAETSKKMTELVQTLDKLGGTLNGSVNTGLEKLSSGFDRLNEAISKMGSNSKSSLETTANETNKFINELNRLINGVGEKKSGRKKSFLDVHFFDTKELEEKREQLENLIFELKSRAQWRGGKTIDANQLISIGNVDAIKRLEDIIENLRTSLKNTQADLENTTKKFYGGDKKLSDKEIEKIDASYSRLTTRIINLRKNLENAVDLKDVIQRLNSAKEEYYTILNDINAAKIFNKKEGSKKEINDYIKRIEEIEHAFKQLELSGGAFKKDGRMTYEAKALTDEKTMLEERIRLMRMTTDEAIKNEQRITAETEKQNAAKLAEFQKLYAERIALEKKSGTVETNRQLRDKQNLATDNEVRLLEVYSSRMKEIDSIISDLSKKYPELAKKAKETYDIKSIEASVREEIRRAAALEKTANAQNKLNEQKFNASLGLADKNGIVNDPKTIEQYSIAIANLRKEIQKTTMDEAGAKTRSTLTKRMEEYKKKLQEVEGEQKKVASSAKGMEISLQKIASAFGVYFSVQSLVNFGRKIVEITGEFELQHRALQAIIGDTQEANRLFDKTVALAVKSPYRIKDLVTYTKQLAAYRIETDKLYETNKMLADISSGLGVDMGRLILAFGQVKAANYLRGQELRQFSEAGVNILGELSKYFSKLEGRAISTGEVFDRVSKRMVSFEDVEVVLKRLTEEGGMFFNMQEIQAETLQGQIANLRDSFDIFLNTIGQKRRGAIINVIQAIRNALDNVHSVIPVIDTALVSLAVRFAAIKIAAMKTSVAASGFASVFGKNIQLAILQMRHMLVNMGNHVRLTEKTIAAERRLNAVRASGANAVAGWASILSIVAVGAVALYQKLTASAKAMRELRNELEGMNTEALNNVSDEMDNYSVLVRRIGETNAGSKDRAEIISKLNSVYGEYLGFQVTEATNMEKLAEAYGSVNERMKNKAELEAYQAGIEKIDSALEKNKAKANSAIEDILKNSVFLNNVVGVDDLGNETYERLKLSKKEIIEIETILTRIVAKMDPEQFDTMEEKVQIITNVLREYFGRDDLFASSDGSRRNFNAFFDYMEKRLVEIGELEDDISVKFGEIFNVKEVNDAIAEVDAWYEKEKKKFTSGVDLSSAQKNALNATSLSYQLDQLQKEAEKKKIDIKVNFGVISEDKGNSMKKAIDEWADETVTSLNEKAKELVGKYGNEFVYDSLMVDESLYEKGLQGIIDYYTRMYEAAKASYEQIKKIKDAGALIYNKDEMDRQEKIMQAFFEMLSYLGVDPNKKKSSGNGGNPALERLNKQISAIKEANAQYKKYLELFDEGQAFGKVKNEFSGLFGELGMDKWVKSVSSFSDSEVRNAFDGVLKPYVDAAGKKGREAAEKFGTGWQYQIDKTDFDTAMKSFTEGMDEAFSQYDLYKELEKLGIGGDISEYVFGISTLSVNQLKKRLEEAKQQLGMFGNGTGAEEEIRKMEKKISEIEDKERVERLKKYTEYLIKGRDEALKIKIDELRQLAELEELQSGENSSYTSDQEAEIRENIRKETQKLLDKNVYDSFKNSSFYTMIFDDMAHVTDRSLDVMYEKLSELREKLQELDPSQVKEIVSAMNKIEGERRSRHPFKNITEDLEILSKWNEKENDERLIELQKEYSELANEKADAIKRAAEAQVEYDKVSSDEIEGNELVAKADLDNANKALNEILDKMRKIGIEIDGINQSNTEGRAALDGIFKAAEKGIVVFDTIGKVVKGVSDAIVEIYGFTDESTKRLIDDIANITANQGALASNIVKAIQSKGTDVQAMAEGIINTIETIRYIVDWTGIKFVREIEQQERSLKRLENAADNLRDAFGDAFTTKQLTEYNKQLKENLLLQIDAYQAMIYAEQAKKNADSDQINEWIDIIDGLRKDIADQENDFYESLGGIVDFRSATEEFVDAWYEAFKETGDGMDGLEEHFNEMLLNMVKKQAVMKVTDRFLKEIYDMIDLNLEDGELTPSEMTAIIAKAQEVFPELNEWLKTFFDSFGDFGEAAESNLTGLQKGIQGVTEETAEIIAAYMNAIRFYSIDSNTQLRSIAAAVTDNSGQLNPMLVELRNIAHRTDDIYSFLYQRRENGTDSIRVSIVS